MNKVVNLDNVSEFEFDKLNLLQPTSLQGGSYFTKVRYHGEPLYFQSPKLLSRNGIVETNKNLYIDLMFTKDDEVFIEWLENLEIHLQKLIYSKRNLWFNNELELSDIESAFTSVIKPYKGGKYFLLRLNIPKNKSYTSKPLCLIFDEHETILENNNITSESRLINIVEIQGIKFTSKNFQIELTAKQIMVLDNKYEFDECVIKVNNKKSIKDNNDIEQSLNLEINHSENKDAHLISEDVAENNDIDKKDNNLEDKTNENLNQDKVETVDENIEKNVEQNIEKNIDNRETVVKDLEEVELKISDDLESIKLKNPDDVYLEIYKIAKEKAKAAKKKALEAYLEVKNIKNSYLLTDLEDSDSDDSMIYDSESEKSFDGETENLENKLNIEKIESI